MVFIYNYHIYKLKGGDTMATESFSKRFAVNRRSEDCMIKILSNKKPTVINCQKKFKKASKTDILKIFGNGKTE